MREGRGGEGEQRDLRPSKAGSPVDTLPSPVAQPRCAAPHPKPPYCCGVLGVLRAQLCLCRKRAANRAPEQEPGQSAVLHQHAPGGASSSITEHPPNAVCLSSPAQRLDGDHPAQARQLEEPGGGACPLLPGALPSPHQAWGPGKEGAQPSQPQARFGRPTGLPPRGEQGCRRSRPPHGATSDSLRGSVQSREGIFLSDRSGRQRSRGSTTAQSHCPVPCLGPGLPSSPTFHPTGFPLVLHTHGLFAQQFRHPLLPTSCSCGQPSSIARTGGIAWAGTSPPLPSPPVPFPIPHLLLPTFFQPPHPSPCFRISSTCNPSAPAPHHTPCAPHHPCSSPDTLLHGAFSPGWIPPGPHRRAPAPARPVQPPGAGLKHSLQGRDLFKIRGEPLRRLCCT